MNFDTKKYSIEELEEIIANRELTKLEWNYISYYQNISESFIEKYSDKVNWDILSMCRQLSEGLIDKYKDKVNWNRAIRCQKLSYSFLEKNIYLYSLYIKNIMSCVNKDIIIALQKKYQNKYEIDKLEYELNELKRNK